MGRKRIPATLKILRGNPGKRAIPLEPQPDALATATPVELTDPIARAEWERAIVPAIGTGHITAADRTMALGHCELFATWRSQMTAAAKSPHVIRRGVHKTLTPNPVRTMAAKTLNLLMQIDAALGFTPTSRSKVALTGPRALRTGIDRERSKLFDPSGRG